MISSCDRMVSAIDGIQLLSLIDKGLDACRYLQAYGQWEEAAWLAKVLNTVSLLW